MGPKTEPCCVSYARSPKESQNGDRFLAPKSGSENGPNFLQKVCFLREHAAKSFRLQEPRNPPQNIPQKLPQDLQQQQQQHHTTVAASTGAAARAVAAAAAAPPPPHHRGGRGRGRAAAAAALQQQHHHHTTGGQQQQQQRSSSSPTTTPQGGAGARASSSSSGAPEHHSTTAPQAKNVTPQTSPISGPQNGPGKKPAILCCTKFSGHFWVSFLVPENRVTNPLNFHSSSQRSAVQKQAKVCLLSAYYKAQILWPGRMGGVKGRVLGSWRAAAFGSLLGLLSGLAPEMLQNKPLGASWGYFPAWHLKCSKTSL